MHRAALLCLAMALSAAGCAPSDESQLYQQIDIGLRSQGIVVDLSTITPDQAAELFLELSSPDDESGGDVRSRLNLLHILRKNPDTRILRP